MHHIVFHHIVLKITIVLLIVFVVYQLFAGTKIHWIDTILKKVKKGFIFNGKVSSETVNPEQSDQAKENSNNICSYYPEGNFCRRR